MSDEFFRKTFFVFLCMCPFLISVDFKPFFFLIKVDSS